MGAAIEDVTLRTYRPGDAAALHDIDNEFQGEVGFGTAENPFYPHPDLDDVENVYLRVGGALWVIEHAREVVGYGGVLRVDGDTARRRRFRVRRVWRRRGLATMLLLEAERFCRERGYRRITLGTSDRQDAAQALYRKHGYIEVDRHALREDLIEIEFAKEIG